MGFSLSKCLGCGEVQKCTIGMVAVSKSNLPSNTAWLRQPILVCYFLIPSTLKSSYQSTSRCLPFFKGENSRGLQPKMFIYFPMILSAYMHSTKYNIVSML
jgi:hypothetical protein